MNALLNVKELCIGFKKPLLEPFSFDLFSGEIIALMGENGSGKSTLLKTFAGLVQPIGGMVFIENRILSDWSVRERARRMAMVRMSGETPDRMSVREFVSLGRSPYSGILDGRTIEDEKIIDEALTLLDVREFSNRPVAELSDGERSRVYLAEAVAQQVNVLLLDEPNAFLDIPRSHALFRTLQTLAKNRSMGIIVSTHSVEYAEKYCDRIMVIDKDKLLVASAKDARTQGLLDWAI